MRRLAKDEVVFEIEGEGELIGDESIGANPHQAEWGTAPALVRSTLHPGKIHIRAHVLHEGTHAPAACELVIESVASPFPSVYIDEKSSLGGYKTRSDPSHKRMTEAERKRILQEVDDQQKEYGIKE